MNTLHVSEAEAARNLKSLLEQVRQGAEVTIVSGDSTIAMLASPASTAGKPEPGHDEWFRAQVQEALDNDPADDLDSDVVEAAFAKRKRLSRLRLQEQPCRRCAGLVRQIRIASQSSTYRTG